MTRDEADNALRQAIIDHAIAYDMHDPAAADEILNDYAVIAHWQKIEADGTSPYTTHYSRPEQPTHIGLGLFRAGELHLADGWGAD